MVGAAIPGNTCPAGTGLTDQTVRNVVFLSAGGDSVRIRLSNTYGTQDMQIGHAAVAVQSSTCRRRNRPGKRSITGS